MLLVGLTGGIGSGKSTVATALSERGAAVVDADALSREIMQPGGLAYGPVVERFGPGVVRDDGTIDRPALAAIVFGDATALADLNALTHPAIGQLMGERTKEASETSSIVVLDIPLLNIATAERITFDAVVVIDTPVEVAVARLVAHRGFSEADARARIAAQITRDERNSLADFIVDNSGDRTALDAEVGRMWNWLRARAAQGVTAAP